MTGHQWPDGATVALEQEFPKKWVQVVAARPAAGSFTFQNRSPRTVRVRGVVWDADGTCLHTDEVFELLPSESWSWAGGLVPQI